MTLVFGGAGPQLSAWRRLFMSDKPKDDNIERLIRKCEAISRTRATSIPLTQKWFALISQKEPRVVQKFRAIGENQAVFIAKGGREVRVFSTGIADKSLK